MFQKNSGIEKFIHKSRVSRFFVDTFLSQYWNFCRGNFLCYRKFLASNNLKDKSGVGGYHDFPSEKFCLTVPKNFVEEPLDASEKFGHRKILCIRGDITIFCRKFFCLTVPKYFVEEPFCVSEIFGNFKHKREVSWFSVENFLSHSAGRFRRGSLRCSKKFGYRKNFIHKRGVWRFSVVLIKLKM